MTYEVFHVPTDFNPETHDGEPYPDGWYWWACRPGCSPRGFKRSFNFSRQITCPGGS